MNDNTGSHYHSVGAHSHGLNSHTHSGPSHAHNFRPTVIINNTGPYKNGNVLAGSGDSGAITLTEPVCLPLKATSSSGTGATGGASGNTANSTAFNTGGNSGNTANAGSGTAHNHGFTGTEATIATLPPYLAVYMWKRTA